MKTRSPRLRRRAGYTLIEVLAASGLMAAAIGAAAALSATMSTQEEMARGQAAAIRYAEAVARLWQLGVSPSTVLLSQSQGLPGSLAASTMSFSISSPAATSMGTDGGISQGSVEKATVTVTYTPYGSATTADINLEVLRPAANHR